MHASGQVLLLSKSARKRRENISGNGEKYLCLERPVFDTHAFFYLFVLIHELKTLAQRSYVDYDFSTDTSLAAGECVCFEGALSGTGSPRLEVTPPSPPLSTSFPSAGRRGQ